MSSNCLIVRCSDRAIFEFSHGYVGFSKGDKFRRLEWVPRSFWFAGKLVRTGEVWEDAKEEDFEVVNRDLVIAGCIELSKRK